MGRVLLAWELGRGNGHVAVLRLVTRRLADAGLDVIVALRDVGRSSMFTEFGARVVQAPVWPLSLNLGSVAARPATSASMGDMLAHVGLAYEPELEAMIGAWRQLIDQFRIDMLLAEFSPAAALAARGVVRVAMTGNGYCQPPSEMADFPLLHSLSPLRYSEAEVTTTINKVLDKFDGNRISRLPQVFEADVRFVSTLPALDPYRASRLSPANGPLTETLPQAATEAGSGIFAYLSPGFDVPEHLIGTLAELGKELTVYAPALHTAQRHALLAAGATYLAQPLDLGLDLKRFALAIHYGVGGTSTAGLLAGVPQLALSLDIEKDLNGQALEEMGCGKLIMLHRPGTRVEVRLIREMAADKKLGTHAREVAQRLRASVRSERLDQFIAECVRLAG
jgi:UDP:flavonoid glycosyltransferase YjiC (YdhE family)